ncbi:MAG: hypothetical protein IJV51_04380 [Oscillospiraceae bacterium]|nr:hypothetical protein [Oscillospiraceae bacterium]
MNFYEEAQEKLRRELPGITGNREGAIKTAVRDALLNFAGQDEEFAQAIVQGGSFQDCMKAVCKGITTSISDFEAYSRAAAFFFPGSKVRFEMHIDLIGEAEGDTRAAEAGETPSVTSVSTGASSPRGGAKGGLVLNLADFL